MFGRLQFLIPASVALTFFIAVQGVGAQTNSLPKARPGVLPFKAETANGMVTFSWPMMVGRWELLEQNPAPDGQWKPVPSEKYQTNGNIVSATLPLPNEATLYRVKRNVSYHPTAGLPEVPAVPEIPTNHPPRKPPKRP